MRLRTGAFFTPANLAKYKVVVFLSTSGNILNEEQQAAFKNFIEKGGGLVAIHAAVAGDVATRAMALVRRSAVRAVHQSLGHRAGHREHRGPEAPFDRVLAQQWVRADEWYNFIASPRGQARVLASLDETTYKGGTMGKDHPIVWCRKMGKGRIVHRAGSHGSELH